MSAAAKKEQSPASAEQIAARKSPVLSRPARYAVKTFADIVKLLDIGADNETIVLTTKADWKAVIQARQAFTELVRACPLKRPGQTGGKEY